MKLSDFSNHTLLTYLESAGELGRNKKYHSRGELEKYFALAIHKCGFYGIIDAKGNILALDKKQVEFNSSEDITLLIEGNVELLKTPVNNGTGSIIYKGGGKAKVEGISIYSDNTSSKLDVLSSNPSNPEVGYMWLYSPPPPTATFSELFTDANDSPWDSSKWRATWSNANVAAGSKFDILSNQGRALLQATTGTAISNKTSQSILVDFSTEERIIEFSVQDRLPDTNASHGLVIAICPTIPAANLFAENNWLRYAVTQDGSISGSGRGHLLQVKRAGTTNILRSEERPAESTLNLHRLTIKDSSNIQLSRYDGSSWINLYSTSLADLRFTSAYIVVERFTSDTASLQTGLIDNISVY